ncbi:hypothetical protein JKG47_17575 [Acidithiobacillus sp. MC6.1]|nr:hypothetical protein [Acidithiobacillus sp. MC6.1]
MRKIDPIKTLESIDGILSKSGGGIYENRELLELLRKEAPDLLHKHPHIERILKEHDAVFSSLAHIAPPSDPMCRPQQEGTLSFPRRFAG